MKVKIFSLCLLTKLLLCSALMFSQSKTSGNEEKTIRGEIINKQTKEAFSFAAIGLFRSQDSTLVAGSITDFKGVFSLAIPDTGKYYLRVSCVGCQTRYFYPLTSKDGVVQMGKIEIDPATSLKDVEIFDERPAYQVDEEKKVYRADKDPVSTMGSTADLLQNIPSVFVDLDGNVKLRGGNVKILIDGKPSGLLGISRKEILDFLPANMIETIEIIDNPSAKYDASGEAGIINIVLKKPKLPGWHANISGSAGTNDKYTGSAHLTFHKDKFTFSISSDYKSNYVPGTTTKNREFKQNNISYLDQAQDWREIGKSNNTRVRVNYAIDSKNDISASYVHKASTGNTIGYTFYKRYDAQHVLNKAYDRQSPDSSKDFANDISIGYNRKFKKKDETLSADFMYASSTENTQTGIIQKYYDISTFNPFLANPLTENISDIGKQTRSMGQIDYQVPLKKGTRIETGVKSTYRVSDLDYLFTKYDFGTNEYFKVPEYTNHYKQSERINAGYLAYKSKFKKISYKFGLRAEQTINHADLVFISRTSAADSAVTNQRSYLDFFPSAHFLRKLKGNNSLTLNYSRRINRPGIRTLNPFYKFIDAVTVRTGNPNLKPEYTHSFEFSYTKNKDKFTLNSSLYFRSTSGTNQRISYLDSIGTAVTSYANFNSDKDIGVEVFFSKQLGRIYRFNTGLNAYRSIIDGTNIDKIYKSDNYNFNAKLNNYFTIGSNWVLQWTGNYVAPVVTPQFKSHEVFFSDLSVRRELFNKKLTLSLRLSDVFNTRKQINEINNPIYFIYTSTQKQTQNLYFSFIYSPGFSKAKAKDSKEEEQEAEPEKADPDEK